MYGNLVFILRAQASITSLLKVLKMSQCATQWPAPTAEQVGCIGTNWSKGWVIGDNIIHDSKCVGITLGKDRASGQNVWSQNPSKDGSIVYNEMVKKVIAEGWSKSTIGSHVVTGNTIYNCGEAGICGSFGAAFSQITGNHIYDIYTVRPFWGAEMGGIKIHAAIDVLIKHNRIHNTNIGIWLDWMAQGTRVSSNLVYDNDYVDFFPEVNHGPYVVDNNFLLSAFSIKDWSEGGSYVHNLINGLVSVAPQSRATPYFKPHSTVFAGVVPIKGGDNRFYNNIFVGNGGRPYTSPAGSFFMPDAIDSLSGYGLGMYKGAALPVVADGNVYLNNAEASVDERHFVKRDDINPRVRVIEEGAVVPDQQVFLEMNLRGVGMTPARFVESEQFGKAVVPGQGFGISDKVKLVVNMDFLGWKRRSKPVPGPLEQVVFGKLHIWPR